MDQHLFELPLTEPLYIFTTLILLIFLAPFIFRIFKIPDVASFIIAGILIGPYGFNILTRDSSIQLFGTVGLLYIMFVVGLELDIDKLKSSWRNSIIFGILTFAFPFLLGMLVSKYILQLPFNAALLISIMFSTHTLVAYPIVRKLGIHKNISVITAIGGTIITDTLVLIILSTSFRAFPSESHTFQILKTLLFFAAYLLVVFYSYPKIAKWFFKYIKRDRPVHFLFLLVMVCVSSIAAKLIGFEPIIGAFVAGIALNHNIPKNSQLMHHVDFVGNFLFIPAFLIGIGMIINVRILFDGPYIWFVSAILISAAILGKWLAAFVTGKLLAFTTNQRKLLFSLSSSRAAATIAVVLIGFQKQIIDENIFNASILIILVTCLLASILTEKHSKKIVLEGDFNDDESTLERILVPVSNTATMFNLVLLANSFRSNQSIEPVYVLNIISDNQSSRQNLLNIRNEMNSNVSDFNDLDESIKIITRVDLNVASGIIRAAKEYMATDIIFGWGAKMNTSEKFFGNIYDHLFKNDQTLYCCKINQSLQTINKIFVVLPGGIEKDPSFINIFKKLVKLPLIENYKISIVPVFGQKEENISPVISKLSKKISFEKTVDSTLKNLHLDNSSLTILFLFRKESVAFNATNNQMIKNYYNENLKHDFILIVPGNQGFYL
ncbi:MAG: cation:proton antiporter [Salinivirgaceae bacterium]|nr:cation:proton antiporter [Salinivirgaceae bacterium]